MLYRYLPPIWLLAGLYGCAVATPPVAPQAGVAANAAIPVTAPPASTPAAAAPPQAEPKKPPVAPAATKRRQRHLLGATYVRRDSLPRAVGLGWKTLQALNTGRNGDIDLFVVEKSHERRLVLAVAQKFWARSLYRYVIKAELVLPDIDRDISLAACSSGDSSDVNELALIDLRQQASIIWLARREGSSLIAVDGSKPVPHACQYVDRGQTVRQSLSG